MADLEEWKKNKINGKIVKTKHFKDYIMIIVLNKITKQSKSIFIFDSNVKSYVLGLDLKDHYSFYCSDKIAKNGKTYQELNRIDNIHKMTRADLHLANILFLSKKTITEHRGTWHDDMIRVDRIVKECEEAIKAYDLEKSKNYWDAPQNYNKDKADDSFLTDSDDF